MKTKVSPQLEGFRLHTPKAANCKKSLPLSNLKQRQGIHQPSYSLLSERGKGNLSGRSYHKVLSPNTCKHKENNSGLNSFNNIVKNALLKYRKEKTSKNPCPQSPKTKPAMRTPQAGKNYVSSRTPKIDVFFQLSSQSAVKVC